MEVTNEGQLLEEEYWQALLADDEAALMGNGAGPMRGRRNGQTPAHPSSENAAQNRRPIDALWLAAQQAHEDGEALEIESIGYNRGGLLIDWQGLHGFVPASQLIGLSPYLDDDRRKQEFAKRVGQKLRAKVIEVDRSRSRFVLSERATYSDEARREMLLADLRPGQTRCGLVTSVRDFGVFVDLGGIEGLIHVSEISWSRIHHPADALHSNQAVDVYVMNVDRLQKRVALSLKRLQPDPWSSVTERYQIDQVVEGVITTVADFGAFVRLEDGVEGLIHVSELAEGNFLHPRNVVGEGDVVTVRIRSIDPQHRRLALSLRDSANLTSDY